MTSFFNLPYIPRDTCIWVYIKALRGVIITPRDSIIPGFSYTPRLIYPSSQIEILVRTLASNRNHSLIVCPSMTGQLIRLYFYMGAWYIACNTATLPIKAEPDIECIRKFVQGLKQYFAKGVNAFTEELSASRVWFFGVYDDLSIVFIGTCAILQCCNSADTGFSVNSHVPPGVPLLSAVQKHHIEQYQKHASHMSGYDDGIFIFNSKTLFGVRFACEFVTFISPIIRNEMKSISEFLAMRYIQSHWMECVSPDNHTVNWFRQHMNLLLTEFTTKTGSTGLMFQINECINKWTHFVAFVDKMIHCISDLDHHVWLNLYTDMKMLYLQFLHVTNSDYTVILRHPKNVYALARAIAWYLQSPSHLPVA